jgi:hypothetical protein
VTFLASSAAMLFGQITTWTARANQAWGASRVWNSGQSFEVDRNAAYDGGSWGVGNLWSADCHNDPNVWTNRYNAGVADGRTAYQPAADTSYSVAPPARGFTDNSQEVTVGTFQVGPAGTYLVWGSVGFNAGNNSMMANLRVYTSPDNATWTQQTTAAPGTGINSGTQTQTHVNDGGVKVTMPAGGWVQFRIFVFGSSGNTVNSNGSGLLRAQFVPTPANPH